MATSSQWISGARPRTLPVAVAPVAVGTAAALARGQAHLWLAVLALVVSLSLQVGVNYANDYSDGIRGTDDVRVGPVRLVGQGLAEASEVRRAAGLSFVVALLSGLALVALTSTWWLLLVGLACVLAAWYYTGGQRPYGYSGLGEVFVFVFFGLVATLGTEYTQAGSISWLGVLGSVGVGALASAILVANNLRDIPTDSVQGKNTLAVRLGDGGTRSLYSGLVAVSLAVVLGCAGLQLGTVPLDDPGALAALRPQGHGVPSALVALVSYGLAVPLLRVLRRGATGRDLIPVLAGTGRFQLVWSVLLAAGIAAGPHL
ncbi:MAG: 1,4-dihydroxy-2-naphthoate polyprenyltransferase [Actinomycetota bacterium]|nr:1,4-dihydroxy-2-naphthoate polyprenyltransferase [Actinomycetota bacterium]